MSEPSPARAVALRVLERVISDQAFADLALDAELGRRMLSTRDTALATELVYGTLRWQRYLDWIVTPHSRRPLAGLDLRPLLLLRMTAYQMVFLQRVPAFAAVHDAVSLARVRARPGAAEFINAVLRAFARRSPAEPVPPADPVEALAVRCSFPTWLAARWIDRYGAAEAETLMRAMNERAPLTVRANTVRTTRDELAARLRTEERAVAEPTAFAPEGLRVEHGRRPGAWAAFLDGWCAVQDEASMLVSRLLAPRPGEQVADVCAAPGTKSTHLAALMENRGRIAAFDPQPARLGLVGEAATRLGISIVEPENGTVEALAPRLAGACDAVLVDAPCSNLGVLRRNPEVKWRRRPEDIPANAARQREILGAAASMVRPGGRLVYATCSLEPEENDDVVTAFLAGRAGWAVDPPATFAPELDAGRLRCRPDRHGTDGFTAVRLRRALP